MKQIKFRHLATLGLCCSLLVNSFTGITAIAETVPIESSPTTETVASEAATETEKKSAETEVKETKATEMPTEESQEKKETTVVEVKEEESEEETNSESLLAPSVINIPKVENSGQTSSFEISKVQSRRRDYTFLAQTIDIQFMNEERKALMPATSVGLTANLFYSNNNILYPKGTLTGVKSSTNPNIKQLTVPAQNFYAVGVPDSKLLTYGVNQTTFTIPKFYSMSLQPSNTYTGTVYTIPKIIRKNYDGSLYPTSWNTGATRLAVSGNKGVYQMHEAAWDNKPNSGLFNAIYMGSGDAAAYEGFNTVDGTITYYIKNRRVTENFVDANGTKITPPTGFTQGKQTVINSDPYTFKQSGTLPDTYKANGKTYKFKGWYKGKTKPTTLETSKTPSYKVTYDDTDDLNVVYEEIEAFDFPALTYQFGFVDESGKRVDASTIELTYDKWRGEVFSNNPSDISSSANWKTVSLEKGQIAPTKNNLKEITYPAQSIEILSGRTSQYSASNITFTLPKYYENISITNKSGTFDAAYPFPSIFGNNNPDPVGDMSWFQLKKSGSQSFIFSKASLAAPIDIQVPSYLREIVHNPVIVATRATYYTLDKPIYYYLTNRKVTENFVDASGTKITPPTGFTQGNKVVIDSENFTYTSPKALPDTYKVGDKTYKFKGWYKGKTKPATLETSKTPSYAVTYDDNDDLNVVYEELVEQTATIPAVTYKFGFVDEKGALIAPGFFVMKTNLTTVMNGTPKQVGTATGVNNDNLKHLTIPSQQLTYTPTINPAFSGATDFQLTVPRYYKMPTVKPGAHYAGSSTAYPIATSRLRFINNASPDERLEVNGEQYGLRVTSTAHSYGMYQDYWKIDTTKTRFNGVLSRTATDNISGNGQPNYYTTDDTMYYFLENRRVTENFVDATGAKITPPTGFTQGNQIPMTSDTFKYTSAKALPTSYSAGGKTYLFQGWYKGKTKPNTLTTSTTPTYDTTFDDNDDMTAVYKEASISANLTMRGAVDVIDNGGTMEYWEVLLKNTGEAPLTSIKIKPTTDWESGISTPTELFILGTGQNTKVRPITKEQWEAGFEIPLDKSLPVGGQLTINLIGTKVTGQPNQVLKAAVEVSGNFNKLTASDTVRIKDLDQEIKEPTGEGFISVPTFDFGQVGVASATKQHGLKKAADYYGNGTRNPYVRISKNQPNWSLTAQLSQPKSATDSLPTATRLLLGAAPVSSFSNYNQPTELKNAIGTTNAINLTANNAATSIIANQQFTGSDVYQLDFTFDNIKLEVPANQGTAGQQYQAAVTWNLVTGP
ncbi:WxL domain-containing protein [Enterococcus faecalis]|nr:WxL domain-containing protein [Enterococcus faecalis]